MIYAVLIPSTIYIENIEVLPLRGTKKSLLMLIFFCSFITLLSKTHIDKIVVCGKSASYGCNFIFGNRGQDYCKSEYTYCMKRVFEQMYFFLGRLSSEFTARDFLIV